MIVQKWDFEKHKYEELTIPPIWHCPLLTELDDNINCINCHKFMVFGDAYTSRQYHNHFGLGYPVCEECYDKECQLDQHNRDQEY